MSSRNYLCPRCKWPMENVMAKYVSREGDFSFLHCFNCGQDFYKEIAKILDPEKSEVEHIILKRVEVELEHLLNPDKYWSKKPPLKKRAINLN